MNLKNAIEVPAFRFLWIYNGFAAKLCAMDNSEQFVSDFLPKVSRTFALAMKFLPERLRHSVNSAYLLCRVADTIEDSTQIPIPEKIDRLRLLKRLLISCSEGARFDSGSIARLYSAIELDNSPDHKLLGESHRLFEVMAGLPQNHQSIIYRWAGEMAGGMAEYVDIKPASGSPILSLVDLIDWDRYCYFVAGTVGRMLSELFIDELGLSEDAVAGIISRSNSFGLGLQKVNTIKDVPRDRERGIVFLPRDIMAKHSLDPTALGDSSRENITEFTRELVTLTIPHLDDAFEYIQLIPESESGIRMFLIVPVFLAIETLGLINRNPIQAMCGPAVKISRLDVVRLTSLAALCSTSNIKLKEQYQKLK